MGCMKMLAGFGHTRRGRQAAQLLPMAELAQLRRQGATYSLLMPEPDAGIDTGQFSRAAYRKLERQGESQVTAVKEADPLPCLWRHGGTRPRGCSILATCLHALPYTTDVLLPIYATGRFRRRLHAGQATSLIA